MLLRRNKINLIIIAIIKKVIRVKFHELENTEFVKVIIKSNYKCGVLKSDHMLNQKVINT